MKLLAILLFVVGALSYAAPESKLVTFATNRTAHTEKDDQIEERILLLWEIRGTTDELEFVRGNLDLSLAKSPASLAWTFHPWLPTNFIRVGDYHGCLVDADRGNDPTAPKFPMASEWIHTPRQFFQLASDWGFKSHQPPYYFGFFIPVSVLKEYADFQKAPIRPVTLSVSLDYFRVRADRKGFERAGDFTLTAKNIRRTPTGEILVDDLAASENLPDFKDILEEELEKASPSPPLPSPAGPEHKP